MRSPSGDGHYNFHSDSERSLKPAIDNDNDDPNQV